LDLRDPARDGDPREGVDRDVDRPADPDIADFGFRHPPAFQHF
jgi:hypothetical protein